VPPLVDKLVAVVAMLVAIRPLARSMLSSDGHVSWARALTLLAGGPAALTWTVGLLALRAELLGDPFLVPNLLGGCLSVFGGMLGVATVLAKRGQGGMSEDAALRNITLAVAMVLYVAVPALALAGLGLTRLMRATLSWTLVRIRWATAVEGLSLLGLCALQGASLGASGLRHPWG
jgi:hypothetical protein